MNEKKFGREIIVEIFPNKGNSQSNSRSRVPYRINPRKNMPRHILIKQKRLKTQRKNITTREKQQ